MSEFHLSESWWLGPPASTFVAQSLESSDLLDHCEMFETKFNHNELLNKKLVIFFTIFIYFTSNYQSVWISFIMYMVCMWQRTRSNCLSSFILGSLIVLFTISYKFESSFIWIIMFHAFNECDFFFLHWLPQNHRFSSPDSMDFVVIWSILWIASVSIETIALTGFRLWYEVNCPLHTLCMQPSIVFQDVYHPRQAHSHCKVEENNKPFSIVRPLRLCYFGKNISHLSAFIASSIPDASIASGSNLFMFSTRGSSVTIVMLVSCEKWSKTSLIPWKKNQNQNILTSFGL